MTPTREELLALAERCEVRNRKLRAIIDGAHVMSVEGQAIAISMVITLDLDIFRDCATALRASAILQPTAQGETAPIEYVEERDG